MGIIWEAHDSLPYVNVRAPKTQMTLRVATIELLIVLWSLPVGRGQSIGEHGCIR